MFDTIECARLSELHIKYDEDTQLRAIIAIHNTQLGPALGGCRCIEYSDDQAALNDAIRLAQGMSYKAALAGLELGGGKAVLLKPKKINNHRAYFQSFAEFVDQLSGRYITALDCGTNTQDMDLIHQFTPYVRGTSIDGDPSQNTAYGVFLGIKSCVQHKFNTTSLDNIHIAIQGLGKVGYALAKLLYLQGATLSVTDLDPQRVELAQNEFNARAIAADEIYDVDCDIFSPCGLGAIINQASISRLQCKIIAGSANNQLSHEDRGQDLFNKNILYAPDYVINSGGLISAALRRQDDLIQTKTQNIQPTLHEIFKRSDKLSQDTATIAKHMAERIIYPADKQIKTA